MVYVCGSARATTITESYNRPLAASPGVMMVLSPRKIVSWLYITWNDEGRPSVGLLVAPFLPVSRPFFWLLANFLVIRNPAYMLFCSKNNCRNASITGKSAYNDIHTSKEREEKRKRKNARPCLCARFERTRYTIIYH